MHAILGGLLQMRRVRSRQGGRESTKKRGIVCLMHLAPLLFHIVLIGINLGLSCLGLENTVVSKFSRTLCSETCWSSGGESRTGHACYPKE